MTVAELIEALKQYPPDYRVELSKTFAVDRKRQNKLYEVTLDFPIIGLVKNDEVKELRLLTDSDSALTKFGKVRRFE
jgi:hypothetical protein